MSPEPDRPPGPETRFLDALRESLRQGTFVKLALSRRARPGGGPDSLRARPVLLRGRPMVSLSARRAGREQTANLAPADAETRLASELGTGFLRADLFTLGGSLHLLLGREGRARLRAGPARHPAPPDRGHDRLKRRMLPPGGRLYLQALGLTDAEGRVRPGGRKKYLQIDRYIELLDGLLRRHPLPPDARVVDIGSGRGALTFALYDHLTGALGMRPEVLGIERRPELAEAGNRLALQCGFDRLGFRAAEADEPLEGRIDLLIALHACDTATDLALARGVRSGAALIVAAPCCHRELRPQMECHTELRPVLRHGILAERQAELLTDGIRALVLEALGYRTEVFEFIPTEHSPKNLMIAAVKCRAPRAAARDEALAILRAYGIRRQALFDLLPAPPGAGEDAPRGGADPKGRGRPFGLIASPPCRISAPVRGASRPGGPE